MKLGKLCLFYIVSSKTIKHLFMILVLEEMLTPEEKALLYEAIGYSETAVDPTLPKTVRHFSCFISFMLDVPALIIPEIICC